MNLSITKEYTFEAAHSLPGHDGACARLHGHSYKLVVSVTGKIIPSGPKEGMIIDFKDLNTIVKNEIIDDWDHSFLNDKLAFRTTAENLVQECYRRLTAAGLDVMFVRLYETAKAYAEAHK